MNQLQIIEHENQRVLTTAQLSETFQVDAKIINRNFQRNSERFKLDKHYFSLSGQELQDFKGSRQFDASLKYTSVLYLWTEKGAWLIAKSINTDKAWEAYEKLIDEYYEIVTQVKSIPKTQSELIAMIAQDNVERDKAIKEVRKDVGYLKDNMRIDSAQEQRIRDDANRVVVKCLGGKDSAAYKSISRKVFPQFWREFKRYFEIPRYGDLQKVRFDEAIEFINEWTPSTSLKFDIRAINNQQHLKLAE